MYITCQQCNTIFRLDESLVKPAGSKVRCCQCRNVFVTYPPAPEPEPEPENIESVVDVMDEMAVEPSPIPTAESEATLDQELEGIDLAELDSILDQDHRFDDEFSSSSLAEEDLGMAVGDDEVAELDEDDLDLDFTIEPEGEEPETDQLRAERSDMGIDDFDLDLDLDMDFELDDGIEGQDAVSVVDVDEQPAEPEIDSNSNETPASDEIMSLEDLEFELDHLDLTLDEDEPPAEPAAVSEDTEGEDLGLFDEDNDLEDDKSEVVELETEALDRALESSLEEDEASALETEASAAEESTATEDDYDLDLSDLDAVLGLDDTSEQAALEIPDIPEDENLELSLDDTLDTESDELSELELDEAPTLEPEEEPTLELDEEPALELDEDPALELEEEPALELDEEPALELGEEPALELDEEPVLELDDDTEPVLELESESDGADATADEVDDLDLSDLDAMLEDSPEGPDSGDMAVEEPELELELESDDSATQGDEDLEDLSFELDSEFEDESTAQETASVDEAAPPKEDEELDLSDIEQMLEGDEAAVAADTAPEAAEGEKWAADGEVELNDADELDLTDIESAIDDADSEAASSLDLKIDDEELTLSDEPGEETADTEIELDDLELELETEPAVDQQEPPSEDDSEELDLSDLGGLVDDQDVSATTETIDSGEIELEFEVSDEPIEQVAEAPDTVEAVESKTAETEPDFAIEDTLPVQSAMEMEADETPAPVKKKRSSKGLIFILILVLLGGAGYLFYAVSYMGLEIPYLSEYLNPKPKDPAGILNLATLDINSKFIENEKSGRLFVVTGKVRNGKDTARKMIRLQGKLYTKGKVLAKTEFSYAGVSLKDQEVSEMAIADIKQRINKASGPVTSIKTLSGQTVPFMIVFSDLPEGLDEFAIEVISSAAAQ